MGRIDTDAETSGLHAARAILGACTPWPPSTLAIHGARVCVAVLLIG